MLNHDTRIPARIAPIMSAPQGVVCPWATRLSFGAYLGDVARLRGRAP